MKAERDTKPEPIEVTETMVFVNTNIQEKTRTYGFEENEEPHTYYEYDCEAYKISEYINYLQSQLTSTELALCEIYEEVSS